MTSKTVLSVEAQKVLRSIGREKREIVQKGYPYRKFRDEIIFSLGKQGIKGVILAEITGLSTSSISRIVETGKNRKYKADGGARELWRLKQEIEGLFKRYQSLLCQEKKGGERNLGRANKREEAPL